MLKSSHFLSGPVYSPTLYTRLPDHLLIYHPPTLPYPPTFTPAYPIPYPPTCLPNYLQCTMIKIRQHTRTLGLIFSRQSANAETCACLRKYLHQTFPEPPPFFRRVCPTSFGGNRLTVQPRGCVISSLASYHTESIPGGVLRYHLCSTVHDSSQGVCYIIACVIPYIIQSRGCVALSPV